jgi:hypothetical protein
MPASAAPPDTDRRRLALLALVMLAVVIVAVLLRQLVAANTDVSWLLTVAERVLDGKRLYGEVIESNPPIAVLAYIPGMALARAFGLRAEWVTDALVFAAIAVSLLIAARMLRQFATRGGAGWIAVAALGVLTILPMQAFGQREHLAMIAALPALIALLLRARGETLPAWAVVAAGCGAAVMLAFKPYFSLALGAGIVTAAWCARSPRTLLAPEHVIAAILVLLYGGASALLFPDYLAVIYPLMRDVYLPIVKPFGELVGSLGVAVWLGAVALTLWLSRGARTDTVPAVLVSVSAGFAIAYLVQRKGWPYHSYPMLATALLALAYRLIRPTDAVAAPRARWLATAAAALLCAGALVWMNQGSDASLLQGPVAQLGRDRNILVLSAEPSIGHPLTRAVGGHFVSRQQGLWIGDDVRRLRRDGAGDAPTEARRDLYVARERAWLLADIARRPPDVVLVDNLLGDWGAWLAADPELRARLGPFHKVATVERIDILARDQ